MPPRREMRTMRDAEPYAAPTPKVLYIHDDLSDYVSRQHGQASPAWHLTREFFALVCRDPGRVVLLTLESQMASLLARRQVCPLCAGDRHRSSR